MIYVSCVNKYHDNIGINYSPILDTDNDSNI
jgi:hypothetical protein